MIIVLICSISEMFGNNDFGEDPLKNNPFLYKIEL